MAEGGMLREVYNPSLCISLHLQDYCKLVEQWEVDENINVDVFEETDKNYPRSFRYEEAQVNVLDEIL